MDDVDMIDAVTQHTLNAFRDLTLSKSEWTHEAHLRVCWAVLASRDPSETVEFLREAIRSYNEATGVANTKTSGYHETLTRYYVEAVASLDSANIDGVLHSPRCSTSAPLQHWTRQTLFSATARAAWIEPDRAALPWTSTPGEPLRTPAPQAARDHS